MIVVSFSGIDGAGKSTQIAALQSLCARAGLRTATITFWDHVVVLSRHREVLSHVVFKGEKGIGTPAKPVRRRDKNIRTWYMTAVRHVLYLLDALHLRWIFTRLQSDPADIVIFDRYIYDELANLPLQSTFTRMYIRLLLKLAPSPHVAYLLDVDPEDAVRRKPEYPLAFVHANRAAYLSLSRSIPVMAVIPPGTAAEVEARVAGRILAQLPPLPIHCPSAAGVP